MGKLTVYFSSAHHHHHHLYYIEYQIYIHIVCYETVIIVVAVQTRFLAQLRWNKTSVRCMCVCEWFGTRVWIKYLQIFYFIGCLRCAAAVIWARINTRSTHTHTPRLFDKNWKICLIHTMCVRVCNAYIYEQFTMNQIEESWKRARMSAQRTSAHATAAQMYRNLLTSIMRSEWDSETRIKAVIYMVTLARMAHNSIARNDSLLNHHRSL